MIAKDDNRVTALGELAGGVVNPQRERPAPYGWLHTIERLSDESYAQQEASHLRE
jgi:hypothetical protein